MPEETIEQLLSHMEEKVRLELTEKHVYEALQYVQSFVARKKKILGVRGVSQAVFLGAKLLVAESVAVADASAAGGAAGNLIKWFIEEGAGADHPFTVLAENLNNTSNYCDVQNLLQLTSDLPGAVGGALVAVVYNPFHLLLTKRKLKRNAALSLRITKFENVCAGMFLAIKHFHQAFKCYVRLNDAERVCVALVSWTEEAYVTERPLFFGRALLTLLAENKVSLAKEVLLMAEKHVTDNITSSTVSSGVATQSHNNTGGVATQVTTGGGAHSSSLAVYHVGVTLTELAALPPHDRVNKPRLFILIYRRYASLFAQLDTRLLETLVKAGEAVFNFDSAGVPGGSAPRDAGPSPMALLQQMFAGNNQNNNNNNKLTGRNNNNNAQQQPAFDINTIMSLLGKMNATTQR